LPDRADLLADLAINQSGWSRLVLKLRSFARWQPVVMALGSTLIFLALLPLLRDGIRQHKLIRQKQQTLRELEQLRVRQNWGDLYRSLNQHASNQHASNKGAGNAVFIKSDSREYAALIQALQHVLFSDSDGTAEVLQKKIYLPFKAQQLGKHRIAIPTLC